MPVGDHLDLAFEALLAELSPDTWRLVLACALNVHAAPVALGMDPADEAAAWDRPRPAGWSCPASPDRGSGIR